jgi:hypothetical protein
MTVWTWGWILWGLWFALEEGLALVKGGTPATLSGHIWKWFGIAGPGNPGQPAAPTGWTQLRRFALLAALTWLVVHFLTGGMF